MEGSFRSFFEFMEHHAKETLGTTLTNSRPLNVHRWSECTEVEAMVDQVFEEMRLHDVEVHPGKKKLVPHGSHNIDKLKQHIRVVLLDLYHCHLHTPAVYLAYSRNNNSFSGPERYNKLKIKSRPLLRVIDGLLALGYIENHKGFYIRNNPAMSRQSRMKSTPKLIDLIKGRFGVDANRISEHPDKEVILLHNTSRGLVDYEPSPAIERMRRNISMINDLIDKKDIRLAVNHNRIPRNVDMSRKQLCRVFSNGSFNHGGRFLGPWWQSIRKELRPYVFISGKPTIELRYWALHIRILYASRGIDYREDPYVHAEPDLHDHLQLIVDCTLNYESFKSAMLAAHRKMKDNPLLYPKVALAGIELNSIAQDLLAQQDAIRHHFFSGIGTKLQNLASKISEWVMVTLASKGIATLLVKDGFICAQDDREVLLETMIRAYKLFVSDFEPEIRPMWCLVGDELRKAEKMLMDEGQESGLHEQ